MQQTPHSRIRAWTTLAVLCGINFLNFYDRQILPAVQEGIRKAWELSDSDLGWLSTAFILLYAVVGVPLGRLADVWRRKWILAIGLVFWSALTVLGGFAWNFWSLFALRLGVGVGEASCAPTASSLIGDLFPPERRARAMSVFMLGLPLGLGVSLIFSGAIAARYGWQSAFFVAGPPGLALAFAALFLADPPRGSADSAHFRPSCEQTSVSPAAHTFVQGIRGVLSAPTMWWIILSGALLNFNTYAIGTFLTSFVMRYHAVDVAEANWVSGLAYAFGAVGMVLAGTLGDIMFRRRVSGRLEVAALGLSLAVPLLLAALQVSPGHPWLFAAWLFPGWLLLYSYYGTVYASIQDIIAPELRGTAMAMYFFAMYLLGAVLGPVGTGRISDSLATRAARLAGVEPSFTESGKLLVPDEFRAIGLHHAMYVVPSLCVILVFVLFAASRTVARDRERLLARTQGDYTARR
jgi:MFS family permease